MCLNVGCCATAGWVVPSNGGGGCNCGSSHHVSKWRLLSNICTLPMPCRALNWPTLPCFALPCLSAIPSIGSMHNGSSFKIYFAYMAILMPDAFSQKPHNLGNLLWHSVASKWNKWCKPLRLLPTTMAKSENCQTISIPSCLNVKISFFFVTEF